MTDFDSIWRTQDEIRTVVNAVLGALGLWTLATNGTQECIWNLSYSERRMAIELELTVTLDDDAVSNLCCQFSIPADYDGVGAHGSMFVFYI
jgi:hypothetical protein